MSATTTRPAPIRCSRSRACASRELTELGAADLRFTPDEAATFLNEVMALGLFAEDVGALEARTEGWIAGLQLAALSMRACADVSGFIQGFTGSNRFTIDYLAEEVLQSQPERVGGALYVIGALVFGKNAAQARLSKQSARLHQTRTI